MGAHSAGSFSHDEASDRLQRLSEEVGRIAADLSRMALDSRKTSREAAEQPGPELSPNALHQMLNARRLRNRYFDAQLFSDPAWDILLEIAHAESCQQRVSISSLSIAASIPSTTLMRWIAVMTDLGLLRRRPDPLDRRRIFIELTAKSRDAMRGYLAHLDQRADLPGS
jgi:DNA-binding MarR family transcriptional regulator